jgi:hypothetical protein
MTEPSDAPAAALAPTADDLVVGVLKQGAPRDLGIVSALKELAPYVLVGIVMVEARDTGLSTFAIHVLDLVLGAGLLAIKTGGKSA